MTYNVVLVFVVQQSESIIHIFLFLTFFSHVGLEKETTTHSSILAWRIPWTEGPGGLQSMGWQRIGHD